MNLTDFADVQDLVAKYHKVDNLHRQFNAYLRTAEGERITINGEPIDCGFNIAVLEAIVREYEIERNKLITELSEKGVDV
jgi:hypothetical protein